MRDIDIRSAFRKSATSVAVMCVQTPDGVLGFTIGSLASLSLDPPLVAWSIRLASSRLAVLVEAQHVAFSLLASDQEDLARIFAAKGGHPVSEAMSTTPGDCDLPHINGATVWIDAVPHDKHLAGDHMLCIGKVTRTESFGRPPLLHHGGEYGTFTAQPVAEDLSEPERRDQRPFSRTTSGVRRCPA